MLRDSFVFYGSFYAAIENLPIENQLEIYRMICRYALLGEEPQEGLSKALFQMVKPLIDKSTNRYKAAVENGKKGGRPKKQIKPEQKPEFKPNETRIKGNQNLNDNVNDNDNVNVEGGNVHRPAVNIYKCSTDVERTHTHTENGEYIGESFDKLFDEFWKIYPRKEHKIQALEIWTKLPHTYDFYKMIIEALKHQILFLSWDDIEKKYIPLPDTWLKDERWEDEMKEENEEV